MEGRMNVVMGVIKCFFFIAILAMVVLPVNPHVIDYLIISNLIVSVVGLMASLFLNARSLSIFPFLLQTTTLFKLGISIAITRQILLHVYAGDFIFQLGQFILGGDFVIGGVIFLIITLINCLVITQGSKLVAKIAAYLPLAAMPSKHMSIDADRLTSVDQDQADAQPLGVQQESQQSRAVQKAVVCVRMQSIALQEALKFVRIDAACGIVMTLINIVGGALIGMNFYGMTAVSALQVFSVLSVGAGLACQISSLLTFLAVGVVAMNLPNRGSNIPKLHKVLSFLARLTIKILFFYACLLVLIALIPSFPSPSFLALAVIISWKGSVLLLGWLYGASLKKYEQPILG